MAGKSEVLDMSDEDFLKMTGPEDVKSEPEPDDVAKDEPVTEEVKEEPVVEEEKKEPEDTTDNDDEPEDDPEPVEVQKIAAGNPLNKKAEAELSKEKDKAEPAKEPVKTTDKVVENTVTTADKEAFYDKVMSGFKANGKKIELRGPDELIQLAQMGANYTAKMQQIAPHRKMLLMLENNGLLDEGKLSYLIDLDKKNPEAIKKLIKEAGIDPLDIDATVEPKYQEGNHRVDDKDVAFRNTLDDMRSDPDGLDTLRVLNSTWDQASKDALYENPEIMSIMHQQRQLGIYDRIAEEVNRQKTLGSIPAGKAFVEAYQQIGKQMAAAGAFADIEEAQQVKPKPAPAKEVVTPAPVATRVAAPKAAVVHNEKASAAAATRSTPRQAKVLINPLQMDDDEFLKQMNGRL